MKFLSIIIGCLFLSITALAKPPKAVLDAFKAQYPTIKKVSWEKEDSFFEAEFKINGKENSVTYDSSGSVIETEIEISSKELPQVVLDAAKLKVGKSKIKEVAKITDKNNCTFFEIEVKGKDLLFDETGKEIEVGSH